MNQTKRLILTAIITLAAVMATMLIGAEVTSTTYVAPEEQKPTLTHRQFVWSYTMEWCESNGYTEAINEVDRDGTSSYGGYQFKPSTITYYAERYGVPPPTNLRADESSFMRYEYQRETFVQMILHADEINWYKEFPDCVKKYGTPPTD